MTQQDLFTPDAGVAPARHWRRFRLPRRRDLMLGVLVVLLCVTFLAPYMVVNIPAGSAGVIWRRFGGGTDTETVLHEGIALIWPWNRVQLYDLRLQSESIDIVAISQDGLNITIGLTFRWFVNPKFVGWLHKIAGPQYMQRILLPELNSSTRQEFSKFRMVDYYGPNREEMLSRVYSTVVDRGFPNFIFAPKDLDTVNAGLKVNDGLIMLTDVLIREVVMPPRVVAAVQAKIEQQQLVQEMQHRVERERFENQRKEIEAEGIRKFQQIVQTGISEAYLKWRGIEATVLLANSPNAKTIVLGGNGGLPLILNTGDAGTPAAVAAAPSEPPAPEGKNGAARYLGSVDISRPDMRNRESKGLGLGATLHPAQGAWSRDVAAIGPTATSGIAGSANAAGPDASRVPGVSPAGPGNVEAGALSMPAPRPPGVLPIMSPFIGVGGTVSFWQKLSSLFGIADPPGGQAETGPPTP